MIFLGLIVYWMFIQDGLETIQLELKRRNWTSMDAKAEEVFLKEKPHSTFKRYETVCFLYSYWLDGKTYYGADVLKSERLYPEVTTDENILEQYNKVYPVGKKITIRINPEDHEDSTSLPYSGNFVFPLILGIGVEVVIVFSIVRNWKKGKSNK